MRNSSRGSEEFGVPRSGFLLCRLVVKQLKRRNSFHCDIHAALLWIYTGKE